MMGVDLTLMPVIYRESLLCVSMWPLNRRCAINDAIMTLPSSELLGPAQCFMAILPDGGTGYGSATEDKYGEPLRQIAAGTLCSLSIHPDIADDFQNRAIWAALVCYPPDWPVVMFWH